MGNLSLHEQKQQDGPDEWASVRFFVFERSEERSMWEVFPLKPQSRRIFHMPKRGKKYLEALKLVDRSKAYPIAEAIELV
ncbi:hypothetical protein DI43_09755 [Geobacillus sp. CAMR12739]|nr:hypothetical protein DI43_09755 [Geobacillus sp. CAMR12739]